MSMTHLYKITKKKTRKKRKKVLKFKSVNIVSRTLILFREHIKKIIKNVIILFKHDVNIM